MLGKGGFGWERKGFFLVLVNLFLEYVVLGWGVVDVGLEDRLGVAVSVSRKDVCYWYFFRVLGVYKGFFKVCRVRMCIFKMFL